MRAEKLDGMVEQARLREAIHLELLQRLQFGGLLPTF